MNLNKKILPWTFRALIALLSISLLILCIWRLKLTSVLTTELDYILVPGIPLSLAVEESDSTQNQVVLDPLVGTLVKYGPTGGLEPYLATSWEVDGSGLAYTFTLRRGLACVDGHPLTPRNFARNLFSRLTAIAASADALEFQKLEGFGNREKAKSPEEIGIFADDAQGTLKLQFKSKPHDLLNLLRMPYYGFYSPDNFTPDGKSKSPYQIISCGAYALVSADAEHVKVRRRQDWFTASANQIESIHFSRQATSPKVDERKLVIVQSSKPDAGEGAEGGFRVFGTPQMLITAIVRPKSPFLVAPDVRVEFARELFAHGNALADGFDNLTPVKGFFDGVEVSYPERKVLPKYSDQKLSVYITTALPPDYRERLKSVFQRALPNVDFIYPEFDLRDGKVLEKLFNNELVDIRVSGVSIGPFFHASGYRMMFCSSLGVGFPDPEGKVCALIDESERSSEDQLGEFARKVSEQITSDAYVIPIARLRLGWIYSKRFDPDSVMPIPNYPRFELLRVR